jgi:hypothetical protein
MFNCPVSNIGFDYIDLAHMLNKKYDCFFLVFEFILFVGVFKKEVLGLNWPRTIKHVEHEGHNC